MTTDITSEEALAHFGVKGMKWGVRKPDDSGGGSGGPAKLKGKERTDAILNARVRQGARKYAYQNATAEFMVARTAKGQDAAEKSMRKLEKEFYEGEDFKLSKQYTTGEKWVGGVSWAALGAAAVGLLYASAQG
jgi:hypothetical protein